MRVALATIAVGWACSGCQWILDIQDPVAVDDAMSAPDAPSVDAPTLDARLPDAGLVTPIDGMRGVLNLAAESFAYEAGDLGARTGGNGFGAGWRGSGDIVTSGLSYATGGATLQVSGGGLEPVQAERALDLGAWAPELVNRGGVGAPGRVVWLSVLVRAAQGQPNQGRAGVALLEGSDERVFVGAPAYEPASPRARRLWGVVVAGETSYANLAVATDAFLVIRVEFPLAAGGLAAIALWTNPPLLDDPGVPTVTAPGPDFRVNGVRLLGNFAPLIIDEIRFGDSYRAVAPRL